MPSTIKLKNGSGAPLAGDLVQGEPAFDLTNKRLYTEDSGGTVIEVGTNPTSITTGTIDATTITADGLAVTTGSASGTLATLKGSTGFGFTLTSSGVSPYVQEIGVGGGEEIALTSGGVTLARFQDGGDISFYEDTGTTAKFFWDASAESLGIGTSSPVTALDVRGEISVDYNANYGLRFYNQGRNNWSSIGNTDTATGANLVFKSSSGEAMRIDSSGNVGIGTSSPSATLHVKTVNGNGITLEGSTATDANGIYFNDTGGLAARIEYLHSTDTMRFYTAASEAMRIDSSGNLLVGKTSSDISVAGVELTPNDRAAFTKDGGSPILANRLTSDGDIIQFRKDGTVVGSIGSNGGDFYFAGTGGSLRITTSNQLIPSTTTGSASDATHDLGSSSGRFKDLYLSGGVYAGSYASFVQGAGGDLFITNTYGSGDVAIESGRRILFKDSGSEAMRLDGSGNLLVGTTSVTATPNSGSVITQGTSFANGKWFGTGNQTHHQFYNTGNVVGTITSNASATSYNTSSDYRLKENVVAMDNASDRVLALKPCRFNFIADPDKTVDGFLAHEAQEVVPEAVTGTKDGMRTEEYEVSPAVLDDEGNVVTEAVMGTREVPEYQGIDQSKLVPLLTKALQEALERIAALEAKVG